MHELKMLTFENPPMRRNNPKIPITLDIMHKITPKCVAVL